MVVEGTTIETRNNPSRWLNVAFGAWVFISAFVWTHTAAQFWNTWIVGALVALISFGALRVPQARFVNSALAVWLFISIWALPTGTSTAWNNGIMACLIFIVSMIGARMPAMRGPAHA